MATIKDILVRLKFYDEGDPFGLEETGRTFLVVEDSQAELELPRGKRGSQGKQGLPGAPLSPDRVLEYETEGEVQAELRRLSGAWKTDGNASDKRGFFIINAPTKSGYFYALQGWVFIPDIFGSSRELTSGLFTKPVTFMDVNVEPASPVGGVTVYAQGGVLKAKKEDGSVVELA